MECQERDYEDYFCNYIKWEKMYKEFISYILWSLISNLLFNIVFIFVYCFTKNAYGFLCPTLFPFWKLNLFIIEPFTGKCFWICLDSSQVPSENRRVLPQVLAVPVKRSLSFKIHFHLHCFCISVAPWYKNWVRIHLKNLRKTA